MQLILRRAGILASALGALLGVARADTVVLRDGRVIVGRVIEQGDHIFVEHAKHGGITVSRSDVVRIDTEQGAQPERPLHDVVVLKDGRIVRGDVHLSQDGTEVVVGLGERGEVRHPRAAVAVIQWRDGRAEATGADGDPHAAALRTTIDRRVKDLTDGDDATKLEARRELLALGAFSRTYLESLAADRPALREVLSDLDRIEALRRVLPTRSEEVVPRLTERLISKDPADREAALRAVIMELPNEVGPLLLYVVKTDDAPRVRAYCVSQMSSLRCFEQLAEVLRLDDGPLRLAAAFALGDAGIYAGVPILIEALNLPDVQIRTVAIDKLQQYTGKVFGYRPQGTDAERSRSIALWNQYWDENGAQLVRDSIKANAPGTTGATITPDEKEKAGRLWTEANRLLAAVDAGDPTDATDEARAERRRRGIDRVQDTLRQVLALDPTLATARMTRAVLLYTELDRARDAEAELNLIIARAGQDPGDADAAKKFAYYHLGMVALRERRWETARTRLSQALQYDEGFLEALEGQGDVQLAMAVAPRDEVPGGVSARREALVGARAAYQDALKAIERLEADLRELRRDLASDSPETIEEGQVFQAVGRSKTQLEQREAGVQFKLGRVAAALQEDDLAKDCYRSAARLDPENQEYRDAAKAWGVDLPAPAPAAPGSSAPPPASPATQPPAGAAPPPATTPPTRPAEAPPEAPRDGRGRP